MLCIYGTTMDELNGNRPKGINLSPSRLPFLRDTSRKMSAIINDEMNRGSNMNGMVLIQMVMEVPDLTTEERLSLLWSVTTDTSKSMYQDRFFKLLKNALETL